jgi:hypothetical protein
LCSIFFFFLTAPFLQSHASSFVLEWESHAAVFVSLGQPLRTLSALLTRWRALELCCWDSMLLWVDHEAEREAADLWLRLHRFLYTACGSSRAPFSLPVQLSPALHAVANCATPVVCGVALRHGWWVAPVPQRSSAGAGTEFDGASRLTAVSLARLVPVQPLVPTGDSEALSEQALVEQTFEAADRFMRSATLGQFSARLALLHGSAVSMSHPRPGPVGAAEATDSPFAAVPTPTETSLRLSGLLFGVYSYYAQYSAMLNRARDAAVAPIVKVILRACCVFEFLV